MRLIPLFGNADGWGEPGVVERAPEEASVSGVGVPAGGRLGPDCCPAEDEVESRAEEAGRAGYVPEPRLGRARAWRNT